MSQEGGKEAFCPVLWYAGGGTFDKRGRPVASVEPIRGVCTRPYDCDTCVYMQYQLSHLEQGQLTWVCPACIDTVINWADTNNVKIDLFGYYSEGYCEYPWCTREEDKQIDWPARYSPLRQIVYGPIR